MATVTIVLAPVNDAPTATNDDYAVGEGSVVTFDAGAGVLANDTDADGDVLSTVLVTGPSNGTLTFIADGSFTYAPTPGFTGSDSFTYRASDGALVSNVATVTILVQPL